MTDYRALCAELLAIIPASGTGNPASLVVARARAALAQPEPVAPTDEELLRLAAQAFEYAFVDGGIGGGESEFLAFARAVLARWGTPEPVAPTDEEIEEWADAASEVPLEEMDPDIHGWRRCFTAKEFSETIRGAIARWGRPTPQPPAELAEMVKRLHEINSPTPQPVAVSERLPGPEDCDEEGRCWVFDDMLGLPSWTLIKVLGKNLEPDMTWLPHHALPVPAPANNTINQNNY